MIGPFDQLEPAAGPVWTAAIVRQLIALAAGQRPDQLDVTAAASKFDVTARTVRRWIAGSDDPNRPTAAPQSRVEAILAAARPTAAVLADEAAKARYAARACERLALPRPDPNPAWQRQGWLDEHLLAVVELPGWGLRRPAIVRLTDSTPRRRRGLAHAIDQTLCPHKFAAEVVRADLLKHLARWRAMAPPSAIARGRTETWLSEAPTPALPFRWPTDGQLAR